MTKQLIAASTVYKKHKRHITYRGKVIIVDGSKIESQVLDTDCSSIESAKMDAQRAIDKMQVANV